LECFQNFKTFSSIEVTLNFGDTGLNIQSSKTKISSPNRDEKILAVPL
jgi:hypothetical protein